MYTIPPNLYIVFDSHGVIQTHPAEKRDGIAVPAGPLAYVNGNDAQASASTLGGTIQGRTSDFMLQMCQNLRQALWVQLSDGSTDYAEQTMREK